MNVIDRLRSRIVTSAGASEGTSRPVARATRSSAMTSRFVLYVVLLIAVIGWIAFAFQSCKTEQVQAQLLEAVTPVLEEQGYVAAEVEKIEQPTELPPGVRTVAVAEGFVSYGPRESQSLDADRGYAVPPPPDQPPRPPSAASTPGVGAAALPCTLDDLTVNVSCRLQLVDAADRAWFGQLLVWGDVVGPDGTRRELPETVARDVRLVLDPETDKKLHRKEWWGSLRVGFDTAPSAIVGGSFGRGKWGGWAQVALRESGTEYGGGVEYRW